MRAGSWKQRDLPDPVGKMTSVSFPLIAALMARLPTCLGTSARQRRDASSGGGDDGRRDKALAAQASSVELV